jgi:hypothetical protein
MCVNRLGKRRIVALHARMNSYLWALLDFRFHTTRQRHSGN